LLIINLNKLDVLNVQQFKRESKMNSNLKNLIPLSVIVTISICIVLLKNIIQDFNEYYGYYDIAIFMLVQFILTFNIYLTIKLNTKGN
tara:strand:+ start:2656 stop:2919 length:264 start_codon:yes stop_codon:yes gene_type:complete